ncbi:MAG: hypothetical protein O7B99_07775 [Planctomycetota bacterium]|nr:hypothetical protein [Planctomycetota bacterium]
MKKQDGHEQGEPALDCTAAQSLIVTLVQHGLGQEKGRSLRAHVSGCPDCSQTYRQTMASAARLGRTFREQRLGQEKRKRHAEHKRLASGGTSDTKRFGLRLFLLAAGMFFLFTRLSLFGSGSVLIARYGDGEVRAAASVLDADADEIELARGDSCLTGESSHARVEGANTVFELGPLTLILIESVAGPRVRLSQGELTVEGPCVIVTQVGVVEVEAGRAHLTFADGVLNAACEAGRIVVTSPQGRRELGAGAAVRVDLDGLS